MSEGIIIALITAIGSLLGGIAGQMISASATIKAAAIKEKLNQAPSVRGESSNNWKGILSGALIGAVLTMAVLAFWSLLGGIFTTTINTEISVTPTVSNLSVSKLKQSDYGKLLYEDNFDKDNETWALQNGSIIKEGTLILQPNTSASPYSDNQYSDFIFETAFRHINPAGNSETDFYLRQQVPPCPGWNCSIQIWGSGDWKTLGARRVMSDGVATRILSDSATPQLSSTDWNKLTVIVKNDEYKIFINDIFAHSFTDSVYKTGKFALASNPGSTAFDYVRIYALP